MDTRLASISGLLLTSAILLAGCNDNNSSSSDTPPPANSTPVTITSANATAIARAAISRHSGAEGIPEAYPFAKPSTATTARQAPTYQRIYDMALKSALDALAFDYATPTSARTIATNDEPCGTSGTITYARNDADNDGTASAGDTYTVTYNQCAETNTYGSFTDTFIINGSNVFTLQSLQGDPNVPNTSWSFTISVNVNWTTSYQVNDGSFGTDSMKGSATLAASYNPLTTLSNGSMSGSSLKDSSNHTLSDGSVNKDSSEMANFNFVHTENASNSVYTTDIDFTLRDSAIGGSVVVNTDPVFSGLIVAATGNANPPSSGTMVITGAEGSTLTLVANGDGTVTLTVNSEPPQTYGWSELGGW
ncbi:MAG TPA: hypothetical protein VGE50_02070 [Gammaproteobacteria bacterium]